MARTLTSANSVLNLTFGSLFSTPVKIQGYSTDDMFEVADADNAEVYMGADGRLSFGWIPTTREFTFTLQADSASNDIMDAVINAEAAQREKLVCGGNLNLSGTLIKASMTRGVLKTFTPVAKAGKTLGPRKYMIVFESITAAPIAG